MTQGGKKRGNTRKEDGIREREGRRKGAINFNMWVCSEREANLNEEIN